MTKAEKQTLLLLAAIGFQFEIIKAGKLISEKRMRFIREFEGIICPSIENMAGTWVGTVRRDEPGKMMRATRELGNEIASWDYPVFRATVFITVATNILADLQDVIRDKKKLRMLEAVEKPCLKLWKEVDPGASWKSYEAAEDITKRIYRRVGFSC